MTLGLAPRAAHVSKLGAVWPLQADFEPVVLSNNWNFCHS